MVTGAIDAALLGNDLRGRAVHVLADNVSALVDQCGGGSTLLDRVVPGAGVDDGDGRIRIHLLRAHGEGVDGPVHLTEGVGRYKAQLAGFRSGTRGHAAQVLALVGTTVEGLQVVRVGGAGAIQEGHFRVLVGQFLEGVGVTKGGTDDDVGTTLNQPFNGRFNRRGGFRHAFHVLNLLANLAFQTLTRLVERLGPAAVIARADVEHGDLRRAGQGKTAFLGSSQGRQAAGGQGAYGARNQFFHCQSPSCDQVV